ncbi:(S)-coclaurine N-methyltransferase Short=TfCNMT [Serendipita indica DSM 11827]|nr:(S)-coclaurine N-methyltransferase Short=TfCNMT [Serendipita indica DSM 11827]
MKWIETIKARETIADATDKANEQHYEVPTQFILSCLGPRAKYSSCLYPTGKETLAEAEVCMLESYCEKADLADGIDILDLGCGWGSLALFLAEKYPNSRITALSNSRTQKEFIDSHGFKNLEVFTGDVNFFDFDDKRRQHMKNYQELLRKISTWLKPNAKAHGGAAYLFVHIFCHKTITYDFVSSDGWMAQHFFTGGTMPSFDLFTYFQDYLVLRRSWWVNGRNYGQTSEDWVKCQDQHKAEGIKILEEDAVKRGLPREEGRRHWYRFRTFFVTVAEFFAMYNGEQWGVGHYY